MSSGISSFRSSLETIESSYEFMLAYAAQGRETDEGQSSGPLIRDTLQNLKLALAVVADQFASECRDDSTQGITQILRDDAEKATFSVHAALGCSRISSQLVDNLNASIHLRAVLTGLFLADEISQLQ